MRIIYLYTFLLMSVASAKAQTDRLDSLINDVMSDDKELRMLLNPPSSYCYLYGGISADSKSFYAGRELGDNMVSANGSLYFMHSKGFFAGISGLWYSDLVPRYNTTVASIGVSQPLNKKKSFYFRASYNRYFYNLSDTTEESVFNNNIGTGISIRNKWIGGRLSINCLFGKDFGMNITPGIFSRITLINFGKYNKIQLEPEISAFIGSESVELEKVGGTGSQQVSQTTTETEDAYGLLNTQFYIPVCFYIGNFDLELGYSINIPSTQDDYTDYPVSSLFSFSIGYLLPLN